MMRGNAARHEIEGTAFVREPFGRVQSRLNLQTACSRRRARVVEHRLGDVAQRHLVSELRQQQTCVSTAGRDIEHAGGRREWHMPEGSAQVFDVFEDVPFAVATALFCELFLRSALNFVEIHCGEFAVPGDSKRALCFSGQFRMGQAFGMRERDRLNRTAPSSTKTNWIE